MTTIVAILCPWYWRSNLPFEYSPACLSNPQRLMFCGLAVGCDGSGFPRVVSAAFHAWTERNNTLKLITFQMLSTHLGLCLQTWINLFPAWISNYIHYKVWWNYLSNPKLQRCHRLLIHVGKRGPWCHEVIIMTCMSQAFYQRRLTLIPA